MATFNKSITRPFETATSDMDKLVAEYSQYGMKIIPVSNIGTPEELKEKLELADNDFGVCAFMASSPGIFPELKELVRLVPEMLGLIDSKYDLRMPPISGGSSWQEAIDKTTNLIIPNEATGLMGEWAFGASRGDRPVRFIITQGLVTGKEGLPRCKGITICIKQKAAGSEDARLGLRTDALLYAGKVFPIFPGGFGTQVEKLVSYTNSGITDDFCTKKFVLIDPVVTNPATNLSHNFWEKDIQSAIEKNQYGFVSDFTARRINDNFLVYRPDPKLSPGQMSREVLAILLAIREAAPSFAPHAGYKPVSPHLLRNYLQPLAEYSSITRIFDNHSLDDRSWGDSMQYLSTAHRRSKMLGRDAALGQTQAG